MARTTVYRFEEPRVTEDPPHAELPRCLVLFSGGLDSTTVMAIARSEGFRPTALVFRYGQRHAVEVARAVDLLRAEEIEHYLVYLDLRSVGASALTSDAIDVPQDRSDEEIGAQAIPPTYVPARNTVFLAHALAWAESIGVRDIFVGVNALDYSGYPDCRPEYLAAFERLANLATRAATERGETFRIRAPLIDKTKGEIIRWGLALGVDYSRTWSCYAPVECAQREWVACGRCDSCLLRKRGFRDAGVADPTVYAP